MSSLKKSPDTDLFIEVASVLNATSGIVVTPAFVEKDWYAVQLVQHICSFLRGDDHDFTLIFTGGTSLSKAHGAIERFSEDLDFLCVKSDRTKGGGSRAERRAFRTAFANFINNDDRFSVDVEATRTSSRNNGRFFRCIVSYPRTLDHPAVRDELRLDVTFEDTRSPYNIKSIRSFVATVAEQEPEVDVPCVSPLDIAADKLSALCWRVLSHGYGALPEDTTFIRHLHDLAALKHILEADVVKFRNSADAAFLADSTSKSARRRVDTDLPTEKRLSQMLAMLTQPAYASAYERYVTSMSYAPPERSLGFQAAVKCLKRIVDLIST